MSYPVIHGIPRPVKLPPVTEQYPFAGLLDQDGNDPHFEVPVDGASIGAIKSRVRRAMNQQKKAGILPADFAVTQYQMKNYTEVWVYLRDGTVVLTESKTPGQDCPANADRTEKVEVVAPGKIAQGQGVSARIPELDSNPRFKDGFYINCGVLLDHWMKSTKGYKYPSLLGGRINEENSTIWAWVKNDFPIPEAAMLRIVQAVGAVTIERFMEGPK